MKGTSRLAAGICLCFWLASCGDVYTPESKGLVIRGFNFVSWSAEGYAAGRARSEIRALATTGATHMALLVTAYQTNLTASEVRETELTPTPISSAGALDRAAENNLHTAIKLHVDVDTGEWRAHITPNDPGAWFESYRRFAVKWARIAETYECSQFILGTELAGTLEHRDSWLSLIKEVRSLYGGDVLYAASWDEMDLVPFWDELDAVGVDAYFPVARRRNSTRLEILGGWQPWLSRIRRTAERHGKEVVLTEVGYRSIDGAGLHPYEFLTPGVLDLQEQDDLYWAALRAAEQEPWIRGVYFWNWPADGRGSSRDRGYSVLGKPALERVREAWAR